MKKILPIFLLLFSCQDPEPPPNPFEGNEPSGDTLIIPNQNLAPASIEGLHANVFQPTCANSGCHDGSFEPDFRSIESTYNTLVYHPIIKNNPAGDFTSRVLPSDPAASVLWERLNRDIDGQSGIMPLGVDPDSDWPEKKEEYLSNIQSWISGGAKDIFGNSPQQGSIQPSSRGMVAYANGAGEILERQAGSGPVQVPPGTANLTLWFSFADDETTADQLQHNRFRLATEPNGFAGATELNLQIESPVTEPGLFGTAETFFHTAVVPLSSFSAGTQVFVRVYVKEPGQSQIIEIPSNGSALYMKQYFSFVVN